MATGVRVAITLACTECKRRNYQTQKSKELPGPGRVLQVLPLVRQAHPAPGDEVTPWHARLAGSAGPPGPPPETEPPPAVAARRRSGRRSSPSSSRPAARPSILAGSSFASPTQS